MAEYSSIIALEIGSDGLPTPPPDTIIIGPLPEGGMGYIDNEEVLRQFVDTNHEHDDRYYVRVDVDGMIQNLEASVNSQIQTIDDRITNIETDLTGQISDLSTQITNSINALNVDLTNLINTTKTDLQTQIGVVNNRVTVVESDLQIQIDGKKDDFTENSAFNKPFGTTPGTVAEGNHSHPSQFNIVDLNGIQVMMIDDPILGQVSVETCNFTFGENCISRYEWMKIGRASDSDSGFIMPHNGVIVGYSAHCENGRNMAQEFKLYIDGVRNDLFAFPMGNGNVTAHAMNVNLPFLQNQKIRLRAWDKGNIDDTVINLFVKWRV